MQDPEPTDLPDAPSSERAQTTGALRLFLLAVGWLSTVLALIGAFLPVLPTTPFLLLAMACFVRTSPELNRRLLANRAFGPYLAQWQHDHTVPRTAKRKAYGLVVVSFGLSIWFIDAGWLRLALGFIALGLLVFLARLQTTQRRDA